MQILKYKYSHADTNIDAYADIVTEMQIQTLTLDRNRNRDAEIVLVTYMQLQIFPICVLKYIYKL